MLMSSFARQVEFFEAPDEKSALEVIARQGWRLFSREDPGGGSWGFLVARPS
jgi:hypothetical protein